MQLHGENVTIAIPLFRLQLVPKDLEFQPSFGSVFEN
jgi:hypothetical protein